MHISQERKEKQLLLKQIETTFLEGESPTLSIDKLNEKIILVSVYEESFL